MLAGNKAYDLRTRKIGALKPSALSNIGNIKPAPAAEKPLKKANDAVNDLALKLNNISVEDIDAEDKENPLLCSEYITEIYAYMRFMEKELAVSFIILTVESMIDFRSYDDI